LRIGALLVNDKIKEDTVSSFNPSSTIILMFNSH
jgi:hypothetical protein